MTDLMKNLARLRNDNKLCDLTLIVGEDNEEIYAHKVILCAYSSYFDLMLNGPFIESGKSALRMTDVDPEILKVIINYMYSGKLVVEPHLITSLVVLANFLQMPTLAGACETHLGDNLTLENCLETVQFAGKYNLFDLCARSLKTTAKNFHMIYASEGLMQIDVDEFGKLISMSCVQRYPQDIIFATILNWLSYDKEDRMQHVFHLLDTLEPLSLSANILKSSKLNDYKHSLVTEWLESTKKNVTANCQKDVFVSKRIGSFKTMTYTLNSDRKERILRSRPALSDGSYVGCGYNIYYTGGWKSNTVFNTTHCMNLYRNEWAPFIPLLQERAYHRSFYYNGDIYSFGGSNGLIALYSAEKMDLISGQCNNITNLPYASELMGVSKYANAIYCLGGRDRGRNLKVASRYDPRTNHWEVFTAIPYESITSSAVLGDRIYCTDSNSLQFFDPRISSWTRIYTILNRYPEEIFVTDNVLYGVFKDHIASYTVARGKWSIVKEFNYHSDYLTVVPNCLGCPELKMCEGSLDDNDDPDSSDDG